MKSTAIMKRTYLFVIFSMLEYLAIAQNFPPVVKDIHIGETNLPIVFINTLDTR